MLNLYLLLFLIGFIYTVCSFLLGHVGGGGGHGDGFDGHGADIGDHSFDSHGADLGGHGFDAHGADLGGHGFDAHGADLGGHGFDAHGADHIDHAGTHSGDLHGGSHDTHFGFSLGILLPLRPSSFMVLLTTFGGIGYILARSNMPGVNTFVIALAVGYILSVAINWLLDTLRRSQNTTSFRSEEVIGSSGIVVSRIMAGGFGRINYEFSKKVLSAPARCESGELPQGTKITIVKIDSNNIHWVEQSNN